MHGKMNTLVTAQCYCMGLKWSFMALWLLGKKHKIWSVCRQVYTLVIWFYWKCCTTSCLKYLLRSFLWLIKSDIVSNIPVQVLTD